MKTTKTYHFTVHSPHFLYPITIKSEIKNKEAWAAVLDYIAKEATAEWLNDFPEYFDKISAPSFYDTLSIIVSQEGANA